MSCCRNSWVIVDILVYNYSVMLLVGCWENMMIMELVCCGCYSHIYIHMYNWVIVHYNALF